MAAKNKKTDTSFKSDMEVAAGSMGQAIPPITDEEKALTTRLVARMNPAASVPLVLDRLGLA